MGTTNRPRTSLQPHPSPTGTPPVSPRRTLTPATPRHALALLATLALTCGCNSSSTPGIGSATNRATATGNSGTNKQNYLDLVQDHYKQEMASLQEMIRILESARDQPSTEQAIRDLDRLGSQLEARSREAPTTVPLVMTDDEYEAFKKELDAAHQEARREAERMSQGLFETGTKIGTNATISARTKDRLQSAIQKVGQAGRRHGNVPRYNRGYPNSHKVTVLLEAESGASDFSKYLLEEKNLQSASGSSKGGSHSMTFAPVPDVQQFAEGMEYCTVLDVNVAKRTVRVELSAVDIAALEQRAEERAEQKERLAREKKEENAREARDKAMATATRAMQEYETLYTKCLQILKHVDGLPSAQDAVRGLQEARNELRTVAGKLQWDLDRYEQIAGAPLDYPEKTASIKEAIQVELDRIHRDAKARAMLAKHFGPNLDAESLLHGEIALGDTAHSAKNRSSPGFFAANFVELTTGDAFEKMDALKRLSQADPRELDDPDLKKEIARAIRDAAFAELTFEPDVTLKALVVWAGKFSVPIMLQLSEDIRFANSKTTIIQYLGKYPSRESAAAVARCVGDVELHDAACRCLVGMGGVAEEAVMAIAPSPNARVSLAAIQMLGEVGTENSLELLREARRSRNPAVKQAAQIAIKRIVDRAAAETAEQP